MGSIGTLIAAVLVAVTYGWMPASSDDNGKSSVDAGYEYLVQIGEEDLRALADGRVSSLTSATPEGMKSIDRVRIVFGEGDLPRQLTAIDRTSPKRLAKLSQTAVKHTVAKPIVSDWLPARSEIATEESGQRHKVYQSPGYQNPGSLGETMQQGSQQLTDAIRSAPQQFGNYINQAGRDFSQGTQDVVGGAMGGSQSNGAAATGAGQSYTPYNYNQQPTLAGQANNQNSRIDPNAGLYPQQPVNNRTQGPALPPPPTTDNSIVTPFGSGTANNAPSYNSNETNPNFAPSNNNVRQNNNSNTNTFNNSQQFGDRRDQGRLTDVTRDSTPVAPLAEFPNRRNETYPEPPQSQFDSWNPQNVANNPRPAANDFASHNSFGTPPLNTQQPVNQTANFANPGQNQGAPSDAQSWGNGNNNGNAPNYNPNNSQNNGGANDNNNNQQNASLGNPLNNPWLMVFLLGSLAGNVYVATSYLDVRNKYRAALRRGPNAYPQGM